MKKNYLNWMLAFSLFAILAFSGCKKDEGILSGNCTDALSNFTAASEAYINTPNATTCAAYRNALNEYINSCTPGKLYENLLEDVDCSGY